MKSQLLNRNFERPRGPSFRGCRDPPRETFNVKIYQMHFLQFPSNHWLLSLGFRKKIINNCVAIL